MQEIRRDFQAEAERKELEAELKRKEKEKAMSREQQEYGKTKNVSIVCLFVFCEGDEQKTTRI